MELAFLILSFITGFLLGTILEKRKSQRDIAKLFYEAMNDISKIRKGKK